MSGWGSWLAGADGDAAPKPNFHAVSDKFPQDALFGPLEKQDLEWTCAGGFATETQTWYTVLEDGAFATSQVIHSAVGLWYPQIQVTFKYFNPATGQKVWKSVNVTKFVTPPPAGSSRDKAAQYDKRSSKADQYSATFCAHDDGSESYLIEANMDTDLQLSYRFTRPASCAGWKLGSGPESAKSVFGSKASTPDGYVLHRFWPRVHTSGHILIKGQAIDAKGQGMFVHAIQGMRPNLVASRWNFANFQSKQLGGVSAVMMEFTTTSDYGVPGAGGKGATPPSAKAGSDAGAASAAAKPAREPVTVNVGSVCVGDRLVSVCASTRGSQKAPSGSQSATAHDATVLDPETGYQFPTNIKFVWDGGLLPAAAATAAGSGGGGGGSVKADVAQRVAADLSVALGQPSPASALKGLVDKVDVLGEIPYMVRKMVNYVAGTKPYIYQTLNPAVLHLSLPASAGPDAATGGISGTHDVEGTLFAETTFISEP